MVFGFKQVNICILGCCLLLKQKQLLFLLLYNYCKSHFSTRAITRTTTNITLLMDVLKLKHANFSSKCGGWWWFGVWQCNIKANTYSNKKSSRYPLPVFCGTRYQKRISKILWNDHQDLIIKKQREKANAQQSSRHNSNTIHLLLQIVFPFFSEKRMSVQSKFIRETL